MSNGQDLKHKAGTTAVQCQMESAWNRKQEPQQSNVTWKVPGTENRYHTNQMSNGQDLKHKTGTTAAQCHMENARNRKQVSQQPDVIWTGPGTQNNITAA